MPTSVNVRDEKKKLECFLFFLASFRWVLTHFLPFASRFNVFFFCRFPILLTISLEKGEMCVKSPKNDVRFNLNENLRLAPVPLSSRLTQRPNRARRKRNFLLFTPGLGRNVLGNEAKPYRKSFSWQFRFRSEEKTCRTNFVLSSSSFDIVTAFLKWSEGWSYTKTAAPSHLRPMFILDKYFFEWRDPKCGGWRRT